MGQDRRSVRENRKCKRRSGVESDPRLEKLKDSALYVRSIIFIHITSLRKTLHPQLIHMFIYLESFSGREWNVKMTSIFQSCKGYNKQNKNTSQTTPVKRKMVGNSVVFSSWTERNTRAAKELQKLRETRKQHVPFQTQGWMHYGTDISMVFCWDCPQGWKITFCTFDRMFWKLVQFSSSKI